MRHKGDSSPAVLRRTGVHEATSLSSRGSISLPVQELVLRRIPRYRNPKQHSRATHAPHASTTVTYRILEVLPLCLNLNESKICRTEDTVHIFLYMLAYVGIRPFGTPKASPSTRKTRTIFSRKRLRLDLARYITPRGSHLASHLLHNATLSKRIL